MQRRLRRSEEALRSTIGATVGSAAMFYGLRVLFDSATLRHLAMGAAVALILVGAFAFYQRVTADPGEHPREWLTETEERELREAIEWLREEDDVWVAGCLWDGDDRQLTDELAIPTGQREFYAGETSTGRAVALVIAGSAAGDGLDRQASRGAFCLVPR